LSERTLPDRAKRLDFAGGAALAAVPGMRTLNETVRLKKL
jgi:hypothetical protein